MREEPTNHEHKKVRVSFFSRYWKNILIILLGILGYAIFFSQYNRAFPQAALSLDLSRNKIAEKAKETIAEYGYDASDYEFVLTFASQNTFYLENVLGIPATNKLIREENLPIWYWQARWFKPLQEEEFSLALSPKGNLINFSHHIPEAEFIQGITKEQAQALAESYLRQSSAWDSKNWELISSSSEKRPGGRLDQYFEWKRSNFKAGESELRISVGIAGDHVSNYNYWLKTPDAFWRAFNEQADKAQFVDSFSTIVGGDVFPLIAIIVGVVYFLRGVQSWRKAILPAVLVGIVGLLSSLNYLPLYKAYYSTTTTYSLFWVENISNMLLSAILTVGYIFLLYASALALNKIVWPLRDAILPRGTSTWIALSQSSWRGLMFGGMQAAYVIGFYYLATQVLGGWSPMGVSYSNLFATPFPFLGPIMMGLSAAVDEELTFRLIGIALLLWLTRRHWIAVLIPALLWALAHLTYVRDPFYMRGIELLVVGVFLGLLFLKFGLVTTIMSHAVYNALLGALPMLRSNEPYFVFSGIVVIVVIFIPMIPGWVLMLKRWGRPSALETEPVIRPYVDSDREALHELLANTHLWPVPASGHQTAIVCLEQAGKLIGAAIGVIEEPEKGKILSLYIESSWRRQYWGSRLMLSLSDTLKEQGAQTINVDVGAIDSTAISFWASQGWQTTQRTYCQADFPSSKTLLSNAWHRLRGKQRKKEVF
jgi:N-acetylglutamate synthase-like GNAT family acetyltransferase